MYTPNADHPYSRESFFNRPLRDSDSSVFAPPAWDLLDLDQLKFRFCVLESNRAVALVVVFLQTSGLRSKGEDAAHPVKPAVVFPLAAV